MLVRGSAGRASKRERQIAELVLQGMRYKDVAISLRISDHTIRNHLRSIFAKLGITSRLELAPYGNESASSEAERPGAAC